MTVILVYHNPGSPEGLDLIKDLARRVSAAKSVKVELVEVDEDLPERCKVALALLPAPGGHLESVKARAGGECRVRGPIDWRVQAKIVGHAFSAKGCGGGTVFYWRAKRFRDLQDSWLSAAARHASRLLGAPVALAGLDFGSPIPGGSSCAFALTVTPGRLARLLEEAGWRVAGDSLLSSEHGFGEVLSWVLGEL